MARQFQARAARRKTQWAGMGDFGGGANLPTFRTVGTSSPAILSQGLVVGGALGLVDEEVTITRMIGHLNLFINSATASAESTVAVGVGVARVEAINAGVGSLPDPESQPDFEWLYYTVVGLRNGQAGDPDGSTIASQMIPFDVRGQRVLRSGSSMVWLAKAETTGAFVQVGGRYLVKLP